MAKKRTKTDPTITVDVKYFKERLIDVNKELSTRTSPYSVKFFIDNPVTTRESRYFIIKEKHVRGAHEIPIFLEYVKKPITLGFLQSLSKKKKRKKEMS